MSNIALPKLLTCFKEYTFSAFLSDLVAGITVGLVALPLAMAFAISSGVPPESGIYCAVIAGFLISALGGSRTQIGGPTGAFVVIVFGIVKAHGIEGLLVCTVIAGLIQIALGVTGLGMAVRFIPRPVVVGFTNGIAVLIASTQIKDFLGLQIEAVPGEFLGRMEAISMNLHTVSAIAALVGATSLMVIMVLMRFARRIPAYIVALIIGTVLVALLRLPVETIGSRFGGIPAGLPKFAIPSIARLDITPLLSPALTVALLGAIESLMSAVVADRMSGDKHEPNVELVAQGIANVVTPFFGGIPATGAIARTATNVRSGATTPIAGMVHALTLVGVLLFAAPLAQFIPLSILSGILFVVAYNMGEWREIPKLLRMSWATVLVWAVTFGLTVFADLTIAVEFGIVLAALMFIRKVANTTTVSRVTAEYIEQGRVHTLQDKTIPDSVAVFRVHGPFLFGAQEKLTTILEDLALLPPVVILRLRNMTAIDATGLMAFEELSHRLSTAGKTLILCSARTQPAKLLNSSGFVQAIGVENICPDIEKALERARQIIHR